MSSPEQALAPLVSAVIPAYKSAYVVETIEAIRQQTYDNIEIVVVDDGSPENLQETLNAYIDSGAIRYVHQENQKMAAAKNTGIGHATGDYIAFVDDDDLWYPEKIEKQVAVLANPDIGLVYTFAEGLRNGKRLEIRNFQRCVEGDAVDAIFEEDFICNSSVMTRKALLDQVGSFQAGPDYYGVDDFDMWSRLASVSKIACIPEVLTVLRMHDARFSGNAKLMRSNDLNARHSIAERISVSRSARRNYLARFYYESAYGEGNNGYSRPEAMAMFAKSFFYRPSLRAVKGLIRALLP